MHIYIIIIIILLHYISLSKITKFYRASNLHNKIEKFKRRSFNKACYVLIMNYGKIV